MTHPGLKSSDPGQAKAYQQIKKRLSLIHLLLTPAMLLIWLLSPLSSAVKSYAAGLTDSAPAQVAVFFIFFSLFFFIVDLPLSFYSGFVIEHRFGLSNQKLAGWCGRMLKRSVIAFIFFLVLIEGLYALIGWKPGKWWVWAWLAYAFVGYVIGTIFPVFLVPLFYQYKPLPEGELQQRILALLGRYGLPAANIFSLNLSKTTKKANAAFMGMGRTKRVVLSDTLIDHFSAQEIEQVVAHELGHFKNHDIWKQMVLGFVISGISFYSGYLAMVWGVNYFAWDSMTDPAGLPLLMLVFAGVQYVSMPAVNAFSRYCEYGADRFSLRACPDKNVFESMMVKLGQLNLADPDPEPWYEFLFYSHPSIQKRIAAARQLKL